MSNTSLNPDTSTEAKYSGLGSSVALKLEEKRPEEPPREVAPTTLRPVLLIRGVRYSRLLFLHVAGPRSITSTISLSTLACDLDLLTSAKYGQDEP